MPGRFADMLVAAAAQLLFLDVPDHAAVDLAIRLLHEDAGPSAIANLANAVLRRIGRESDADPGGLRPAGRRYARPGSRRAGSRAYGEETARAIAAAHAHEPAVDLTVDADPRAAGRRRSTRCSCRPDRCGCASARPLPDLPGYAEGGWWVQDAAAALPARLLAAEPGRAGRRPLRRARRQDGAARAAGAAVLAVDRSAPRLRRLATNMDRLGSPSATRPPTRTQLEETGFDAVLLDAPCSATGTLRRHPDVAWTKREEDVSRLAALQTRLLDRAGALLRPGGRIVYCTCSLEKEEGERQIAALPRAPSRVASAIPCGRRSFRAWRGDHGRGRRAHAAAHAAARGPAPVRDRWFLRRAPAPDAVSIR